MFKEAFVTIIVFIIVTLLLSLLLSKKRRTFQVLILILLTAGFLANTVYNLRHLFPDFVLDETVPLGDCRENLFLYKDDSEFPCEILFPVLNQRTVLLDTSCDFYDVFFSTFSGEVIPTEIPAAAEEIVYEHKQDFTFAAENNLIYLLDYAFPSNADTFIPMLPSVYINVGSLEGEDTLVAMIDQWMHIYLMSETYYHEITDHENLSPSESACAITIPEYESERKEGA